MTKEEALKLANKHIFKIWTPNLDLALGIKEAETVEYKNHWRFSCYQHSLNPMRDDYEFFDSLYYVNKTTKRVRKLSYFELKELEDSNQL